MSAPARTQGARAATRDEVVRLVVEEGLSLVAAGQRTGLSKSTVHRIIAATRQRTLNPALRALIVARQQDAAIKRDQARAMYRAGQGIAAIAAALGRRRQWALDATRDLAPERPDGKRRHAASPGAPPAVPIPRWVPSWLREEYRAAARGHALDGIPDEHAAASVCRARLAEYRAALREAP